MAEVIPRLAVPSSISGGGGTAAGAHCSGSDAEGSGADFGCACAGGWHTAPARPLGRSYTHRSRLAKPVCKKQPDVGASLMTLTVILIEILILDGLEPQRCCSC